MLNSSSPSLADIAAVTGTNNDSSWGNGNGWWVLIILFAIFGGWGNGWNNGNGSTVGTDTLDSALQRGFDNQSVMNKLNGLENGLCDGFYAVNTSLLNGFATQQNAVQQGQFTLQQAINDASVANMQNTNAIQTQLSNCCCENREAIAQTRYDLATDTCAVTTAISQAARDITDNANANYRAIHDELVQAQLDAKNEKIAEQASLIQSLNLAQSQANQNQYLINQLRPAAVPAFNVPNPYASYGYGCYCNSASV